MWKLTCVVEKQFCCINELSNAITSLFHDQIHYSVNRQTDTNSQANLSKTVSMLLIANLTASTYVVEGQISPQVIQLVAILRKKLCHD